MILSRCAKGVAKKNLIRRIPVLGKIVRMYFQGDAGVVPRLNCVPGWNEDFLAIGKYLKIVLYDFHGVTFMSRAGRHFLQ